MTTFPSNGVIDLIHGVSVKDPYRWLEDRESPETQEWLATQRSTCASYFAGNQLYKPLETLVRERLSSDAIDQAAKAGDHFFFRRQARNDEQACIWVRCKGESLDRMLVDPGEFGASVSVGIHHLSSDGTLMAYYVRRNGSDAAEVRVLDVVTGVTFPEHIGRAYMRGFAFDATGLGFSYCAEPLAKEREHSIRYHRLGESILDDVAVFTVPRGEHTRLVLVSDDGRLGALVSDLKGHQTTLDLYVSPKGELSEWKRIYRRGHTQAWPFLSQNRTFLYTREDETNGTIVELAETGERTRVIVPEAPYTIQRYAALQGYVFVSYSIEGEIQIEQWTLNGDFVKTLDFPAKGSVQILPTYGSDASSVFFLWESYTEPPTLFEYGLLSGRDPIGSRSTLPVKRRQTIARECSYTSRDGTNISMVLHEPAEHHCMGVQPVVLASYGGFGVPEIPRFSHFFNLMIEFGFIIARPRIRGGSDFGEQWHTAAIQRHRQTAIDDFIAAAEWLCSQGITDAKHLAIVGGSNGGLLVSAAMTQKPELYQAVVCTGPLLDMVRYERFDQAARWRREYGTVEDPDDFRALLSYSPYHNVKQEVDYPAVLFVTGDSDDRCNPAHVRKTAALLQGRPSQSNRVLVDYSREWGHVPTSTLAERVASLARKVAFVCQTVGLTLPGDTRHDF